MSIFLNPKKAEFFFRNHLFVYQSRCRQSSARLVFLSLPSKFRQRDQAILSQLFLSSQISDIDAYTFLKLVGGDEWRVPFVVCCHIVDFFFG